MPFHRVGTDLNAGLPVLGRAVRSNVERASPVCAGAFEWGTLARESRLNRLPIPGRRGGSDDLRFVRGRGIGRRGHLVLLVFAFLLSLFLRLDHGEPAPQHEKNVEAIVGEAMVERNPSQHLCV